MEAQKKQKVQKVLSIVLNVLVAIILVLALVVTINNIISSQKGYTSYFGTAFVTVESESMNAEKPAEYPDALNGFAPGDLLTVKVLEGDDLKNLKEGDIVSFYLDVIDGNGTKHTIINSHRIIKVEPAGSKVTYQTKGDNNDVQDPYQVYTDGVKGNYQAIGVVTGNAGGIGKVFQFFRSSTGFLVCVVVPSFLVVAYFAFNLIREIMKNRKLASVNQKAQMKEELLAELREQGLITEPAAEQATDQTAQGEQPPEQSAEKAAEQPAQAEVQAAVIATAQAEEQPATEQPTEAPAEVAAEPAEPAAEAVAEQSAQEEVQTTAQAAVQPEETPAETAAEPAEASKPAAPKKPAAKKPAAKTTAKKSTSTQKKPATQKKTSAKKPAAGGTKKPSTKTSTAKNVTKK